MDDSHYHTGTAADAPISHTKLLLRTAASALVFGVAGGALGNWLGKLSNEANNQVTQRLAKWSMGLISATLAAYSSIKYSEGENKPPPTIYYVLPPAVTPEIHPEMPTVHLQNHQIDNQGRMLAAPAMEPPPF